MKDYAPKVSCARRRNRLILLSLLVLPALAAGDADPAATAWPQFRGPGASGVAPGDHATPITWDVPAGKNVLWKASVPGLGLSSPVVWGDRVFITTAVAAKEVAAGGKGAEELKVGLYGDVRSVP